MILATPLVSWCATYGSLTAGIGRASLIDSNTMAKKASRTKKTSRASKAVTKTSVAKKSRDDQSQITGQSRVEKT